MLSNFRSFPVRLRRHEWHANCTKEGHLNLPPYMWLTPQSPCRSRGVKQLLCKPHTCTALFVFFKSQFVTCKHCYPQSAMHNTEQTPPCWGLNIICHPGLIGEFINPRSYINGRNEIYHFGNYFL